MPYRQSFFWTETQAVSSESKFLSTWSFDILAAARTRDGTSGGWQAKGLIKNVAGTTTLVGSPTVTSLAADPTAASWNVVVEADDASDALVLKAVGANSTTIRWVANIRATELTFAQ